MTPTQRRAHCILLGQTLLDAWEARAKLRAEGNKLRIEGSKLYAEGTKLCTEGDKLYAEGTKLYTESSKLRAEGHKLYTESTKLWAEAVAAEFGPGCTMEWDGGTCRLSVGEVYEPLTD